jgi:hypothetical protein
MYADLDPTYVVASAQFPIKFNKAEDRDLDWLFRFFLDDSFDSGNQVSELVASTMCVPVGYKAREYLVREPYVGYGEVCYSTLYDKYVGTSIKYNLSLIVDGEAN